MNEYILACYSQRAGLDYCHSRWGCKHLVTEISLPEGNKAKLFSKVYREAKEKGVLDCPVYNSMVIEEVLETLNI